MFLNIKSSIKFMCKIKYNDYNSLDFIINVKQFCE